MAQIQIKNVYKSYGHNVIFDGATASFSTDQKVGVIGRNGAGKSTLCKILTGQEEMDDGELCKSSDLVLSYLEQHDPYHPEETVIEFLTRYTHKAEWECAKIAVQFQIGNELLHSKIKALSGGYQTRVKLTAMLIPDPNFLILDEPSNYLDLNTLILLENFLQNFDGGYLIVSHDREFLKRTCTHTLEVEKGDMALYPGNVEEYLTFKDEQKEKIESYNKSIEVKKRQLQNFVDRFKANASKAALAQSKMKLIDKLETIEITHPMGSVRIRIPSVDRRYGLAFRCRDLAIGYPEKLVASGIDLEVERGKKIAVLGENGQGKTTFMRTIASGLVPKGGQFHWGAGTKIAYYAQHVLSMLDVKDDVYTHLKKQAAQGLTHQDILAIAGSFLFRDTDVEKKISVLSGGERARLCLAGLLLTRSNVLLLDEPTNHLDFETVEALGYALKNYDGTVFFISHDRTFVNLVATSILDVKNGAIIRYPGTYEEYVYSLEKKAHELGDTEAASFNGKEILEHSRENIEFKASSENQISVQETKEQKEDQGVRKPLNYLEKKALRSEIKKLGTRAKKIEQQMEFYKTEKASIEKTFADNPSAWTRKLNDRLVLLNKMLEEEEAIWLDLQQKMEAMNQLLKASEVDKNQI